MKKSGIFLTIAGTLLIILNIIFESVSDFKYENEIGSHWNLAEKSSTIDKKSEHIDKFVIALENSNLKGKHNAIFLKTQDNSFDSNLEALKSLQIRLHEIEKMDVSTFEYQTAIQQITQQEMNEAGSMLNIFKSIWMKENFTLLWNWIGTLQILFSIILLILGIIKLLIGYDWFS